MSAMLFPSSDSLMSHMNLLLHVVACVGLMYVFAVVNGDLKAERKWSIYVVFGSMCESKCVFWWWEWLIVQPYGMHSEMHPTPCLSHHWHMQIYTQTQRCVLPLVMMSVRDKWTRLSTKGLRHGHNGYLISIKIIKLTGKLDPVRSIEHHISMPFFSIRRHMVRDEWR